MNNNGYPTDRLQNDISHVEKHQNILPPLKFHPESKNPLLGHPWDIHNTHKKTELPPLKSTVDVYRNIKRIKNPEIQDNYNEESPESVNKDFYQNNNIEKNRVDSRWNLGFDENEANERLQSACVNSPSVFATRACSTSLASNRSINGQNKENEQEPNTDYRKLALELAANKTETNNKPKKRRRALPDYILVYDANDQDSYHLKEREQFESAISKEDIEIEYNIIGTVMFVELYASFERLCQEAEQVALEMPLEGFLVDPDLNMDSIFASFTKSMVTDDQADMISAPFCCTTRDMFFGIDNQETFFRSSYRSMLVKNILDRITISLSESESVEMKKKTGLCSLLLTGSYSDTFMLHERSKYSSNFQLSRSLMSTRNFTTTAVDSRQELHDTWLKCFKYQPLWKIRNYYGEKIGLYFAWLGVLISSLWVPTLLGIVVFIYGFVVAFRSRKTEVSVSAITTWTTSAFDNNGTPYFTLIICLWGTVFCEFWKRKNAMLAYKWDVDLFEEQETNRPQFVGTIERKDPVTGEIEPYYPKWRKALKSMGSAGVIVFMVALVVTSVISVAVYKVVARVDWFISLPNGDFASSLTSSVLNSISILILGRVYKTIAYKLTDWENHKTKTKYEDALIIKLFGFQFVNSYSSLFYIAFFREGTSSGMFGLGKQYSDSCNNEGKSCMSLLSMQVAVLMIAKPMPKFCTDILLPFVVKFFRKFCCCFKSKNIINTSNIEMSGTQNDPEYQKYLEEEYKKPPLGDFTLSEYTEKVLQYGYLMMFAAAFPLAPLIALLTNLIDLRVDARRMLWLNRRPVAERAEDIGMWFTILNLLNYAGMMTNALILSLTSKFGRQYRTDTLMYDLPANTTLLFSNGTNSTATSIQVPYTSNNNLWIVIIFQNVVLVVKFVLAYAISDVPESVSKAKSQEKAQLGKFLTRAGMKLGPGKTIKKDEKMSTTPSTKRSYQKSSHDVDSFNDGNL